MRPISALHLSLAALIILSAGCSSNKSKIEGTKWSSQAAVVKGVNAPAGALSLDFAKDGSLVYRAGPQTFTGKYSLGMGSNVTLKFEQDLAGRKVHVEKISIGGDQLTMTDSDGTQVTFNKVR